MATATEAPVVDAETVDDDETRTPPEPSTAVVRHEASLSVAPQVQAAELGARLAVIKEVMDREMIAGVDYGVIPNTNKPTLLKPGAEKLNVLFQLDVQLDNQKSWGPGDHLTVESHATVFHAPTGQRLGYGEGMCTTREKKYGKRRQDRACPSCGQHTILKSKDQPEFFCWRKKGGCGAVFPEADERIASQEVGEVENPDLPDMWNTVIKMASKRARVDAILSVTGASALFTQDVEEQHVPDNEQPAAATGPKYGVAATGSLISNASAALTVIYHGDQDEAEKVWTAAKGHMGGYMPEAAALMILKLSSEGVRVVTDPVFEDPDGHTPAQPQDEAAEAAEAAGLEDEAVELWSQLESKAKAAKRVNDAHGNVTALRAMIEAAEKALAEKVTVKS